MYKTILVPLDGSRRAQLIMGNVEELALRCGSKVVLLQVVDPVSAMLKHGANASLNLGELDKKTEKAKAYMAEIKAAMEKRGIPVEVVVSYGSIVDTIMKVAAEVNASVIAIASHGRSGLARVYYGSVAAGLLQCVDRPLLIIRATHADGHESIID